MDDKKNTLGDDSIQTERVGRRSAVAAIGGTLLGGLALAVGAPTSTASAKQTDNDSGPNADPAGGGRGRSGCSDSDSGSNADPAGNGRSCGRTR